MNTMEDRFLAWLTPVCAELRWVRNRTRMMVMISGDPPKSEKSGPWAPSGIIIISATEKGSIDR